MILLIDAGNTRIKWRLISHTFPASPPIVEDVYPNDQIHHLATILVDYPSIKRIIGTHVAAPEIRNYIDNLAAVRMIQPEWIHATAQYGKIRNQYITPESLGPDRWAALIGAYNLHPHACLVVTAGTATTVDLLDSSGMFLGGLIVPGTELMKNALASKTARLTHQQGTFHTIPQNTADAIHSGCLHAQAGAVERMFKQIANTSNAICILSGGAASSLAPLLTIPIRLIDNIVLEGLTVIARSSPSSFLYAHSS